MRKPLAVIAIVGALAAVAGCGGASPKRTSDGRITVVAGENFWGDLAQQVGGTHIAVTSLITSPDADPHLFEPGTQNGLAVATASVVIVNGANYDPFMDRLLKAAPSSKRRVVRVASVLHISGSDPNPHLWYDVPRLPTVVNAIAQSLEAADPANAAAYRAGAASTIASLKPLRIAVARLRVGFAGAPVAYTERVPGYLLAAAHLRVLTPSGFARSIENGSDPSAADDLAMRQLITQHRIKALLYNEQATSPLTAALQQLAAANHVPIVAVTETMPAGLTFESWQLEQVDALSAALAG